MDLEMLSVMMKLSECTLEEYGFYIEYSRLSSTMNSRYHSIKWMRDEIFSAASICFDERDTCIQVFDKFICYSLAENPEVLADTGYLTLAAATSVALSSKLHNAKSRITMANSLLEFERIVLTKIEFNISPLVTPSNFVRHLLQSPGPHCENIELLCQTAESFIDDFWEETEAVLFAPSTIAISALLLSFSVLKMDCREWLQAIPDICLPKSSNEFYMQCRSTRRFDVDGCLQKFQNLPSVRRNLTPHLFGLSQSPVSVARSINSPLILAGQRLLRSPPPVISFPLAPECLPSFFSNGCTRRCVSNDSLSGMDKLDMNAIEQDARDEEISDTSLLCEPASRSFRPI